METLKFLFTTSYYPPYHLGGDAIHVKYLAEELRRYGHEIHILHSLDAYNVKRKNTPKSNKREDIYTYPIKTQLNSSSYAAYMLGNSRLITKKFNLLLKEIKPDVVHHHNISLLGYNLLKKRSNYINLFTAHDCWLVCQQNNLLKNGVKLCRRQPGQSCFTCALKCRRPPQIWRSSKKFKHAIEDIDLIISPSNSIKSSLLKEINVKSVTLPNFVPSPPENIAPTNLSNYFLYVGMLEKHKGILNLLEAFRELKNQTTSRLIIVGDGSLKRNIIQYIKENSLEKNVSFMGYLEKKDLYPLYRNAIALVIPSICAENSPLTALEALSVGTPVIVSTFGGLPEIGAKIDKNLIFDNSITLKKIVCMIKKESFSQYKIREIYEKNFSSKRYIESYLSLIRSLKYNNSSHIAAGNSQLKSQHPVLAS
jgi:glycosyltransferase involved in cell wall biosynthesis